ncbi:hypothetical protein ACCC84_21250 [Serratia odorifera]|uniref:hypothetical protein n=1 Tax=Serratia odorifera TaxID=618 RepID=UPI003531A928
MEGHLLRGLQKLGVPCFFPAGNPLAATDRMEAAALCHAALMKEYVQIAYLCPLDCAGDIPRIKTDNATFRVFSEAELNALLNSPEHQRQSGFRAAETNRLSQFLWLVVEESVALPKEFDDRYWHLPLWHTRKDQPGTVYPYNNHYPAAVESAIFRLMLAPWEQWLDDLYNSWHPFHIPWVHTITDDIFRHQDTIPSATTLTWDCRSWPEDEAGDWLEHEVPYDNGICVSMGQLAPFVDPQINSFLGIAISRGLINTAAQHQFVKAFLSDDIDEFLAHIVVIDACLGEKSVNKDLEKRLKKLGSTGRLKYRLVGLLNDASAKESMHILYKVRSDYVHGNALEKIPAEYLLQARILARQVLNAVIAAAGHSPDISREELLDGTLRRGWEILGAD